MAMIRVANAVPGLAFCLYFIAVLLSAGCSKGDGSFSYRVTLDTVAVEKGSSLTTSLNVELLSGSPQDVRLSIEQLPDGVMASLLPTSGFAPYSSAFMFYVDHTVLPGSYPFTVRARSEGQADQVVTGHLMVTASADCVTGRRGIYNATESCTPGRNSEYAIAVEGSGNVPNRIQLVNLNNLLDRVEAQLDCGAFTLTIPNQTVAGISVSGSGSFTETGMAITYTMSANGVQSTCTANLVK